MQSKLILEQMMRNIQEREAKGIDQKATWEAIEAIMNEEQTDDGEKLADAKDH